MPLICYEVIFPKNNINPDTRPLWLLNTTNDGWYGNSSGPYQHFHMARMRAIEQGVPLIRAANTGISAIIDSYGRVQASLALGTDGVIDGKLPASIPQTPYSKYGDMLLLLVVYVLGMVTLTGLKEED
jgi:apolipoprotein N-acyltransferase